jgi:hypothetical protein
MILILQEAKKKEKETQEIVGAPTFRQVGESVDNRGLALTAGVIVMFAVAVAVALAARWGLGKIRVSEKEAELAIQEKIKRDSELNQEREKRLKDLDKLESSRHAELTALTNLELQRELRLAQASQYNSELLTIQRPQYIMGESEDSFHSSKINNVSPIHIAKPYGLNNHTFFYKMQHHINNTIPTLEIEEPLRQAIFRDFLLFKFSVLAKNLEKFIEDGNIDRIPSELFFTKMHKVFDDSITQSNQRSIDKGIPQVVLNKFQEWHKPIVEQFRMFLADVCRSTWYSNNTQKTVAVMDYLNVVLHFTLINAQKTIQSLNGELDGVEYRGRKSKKKKKPSSGDHGEESKC